MKKIYLLLLASIVLQSTKSFGQQDATFTHYGFNTLAVNPAYAGSRDVITITGLMRNQWVGFPGAPRTQTITFHSPVFTDAIGIGLSVLNDKIGTLQSTSITADLSYRLALNEDIRLAFGLKGGANLQQSKGSSLDNIDEGDASFQNLSGKASPNLGAGFYLSHQNWYLGGSAPKLFERQIKDDLTGLVQLEERRSYHIIAGGMIPLKDFLALKPSTNIKMTKGDPLALDLTALFIIKEKLELGLMGRTGKTAGALIGFNFSSQFRVGYSYDWSMSNDQTVNKGGSHELIVRYDIVNLKQGKQYSPRYF